MKTLAAELIELYALKRSIIIDDHRISYYYENAFGMKKGESISQNGHFLILDNGNHIPLSHPLTDEEKTFYTMKYGNILFLPIECVTQFYR